MVRKSCPSFVLYAAGALLLAGAVHAGDTPLTTVRIIGPGEGVDKPVLAVSPPGDERLFIVGESGQIRIYKPGLGVNATPFIDLGSTGLNLIVDGAGNDERGLLGLAFHPDYANNGYFYLNYSRSAAGSANGDTVIARMTADAGNPDIADPTSGTVILVIDQTATNHNGGMLAFGHDGMLYVGMGDGGGANDFNCQAQKGAFLLGKMLRIDVDGGSPYAIPADNPFIANPSIRDEVWHIGLRNPWRWSFDQANGDMYIGDVGQGAREEIDYAPAGVGGINFGWKVKEGLICGPGTGSCPPGTPGCTSGIYTDPIEDYVSTGECSVTGGFVYRGCAIPDLQGTYFYADWCSDRIWTFKYDGAVLTDFEERTAELDPPGAQSILNIAGFGQDANGEIYILDRNGDEVFKVVPATPVGGADCDADGQIDECEISKNPSLDLNDDGVLDACQSLALSGDVGEISVADGGIQNLTLDAGAAFQGDIYLIVGTLSGTVPGLPVDSVVLPINFDLYTTYTLVSPNPPLVGSFGLLGTSGEGAAAWSVLAGQLSPGDVGKTLHHAYVVYGGITFDFASNAIRIDLVD